MTRAGCRPHGPRPRFLSATPSMRAFLGIAVLLVAVLIVGLAARQMLSRPPARPAPAIEAGVPQVAPATSPRATVDQVRRDLEEANEAAARRAAEADR